MRSILRGVFYVLFVSVLLTGLASTASAAPPIEWSPGSVSAKIGDGQGASTPLSVSFQSSSALTDVSVWVVPELRDFITAEPNHFASIEPGVTYTVLLHRSVAPYAVEGFYLGTVHLREGKRTVAKPLPVTIEVEYGENAIKEGVRVLSAATLALLADVSGTPRTLTFSSWTPEMALLEPGNILLLPPTELLPDGLLIEITTIVPDGASVRIGTVPASLADVFVNADLSLGSTLAAESAPTGAMTDEGWITAQLDAGEWFLQLGNVELLPGVTASGTVRFDGSFSMDLEVRDSVLTYASFEAEKSVATSLTVRASVDLVSASAKCYLLRDPVHDCHATSTPAIRLRPIVIWAGYVPVVFTPVLNVVMGIDGSVSVGLSATVRQTATLRAGVIYDRGALTPSSSFTNTFEYEEPALGPAVTVKAYTGPQLDLLLYGLIGPHLIVDGFLELDVEPVREPWWKLFGGLEARIGLTIFRLHDEDVPVFSIRTLIAEAPPRPPACDTTPSGNLNGKVFVTGGSLAGQAVGGSNWTVTVEPGAPIVGSVEINTINLMPPSAVAPFGYTWTWGNRTSDIVGVHGRIPTGSRTWTLPINLTAPTTPGTYYVLFAFQGEFNMAQVMSATNWSTRTIVWNDGNDLVDVSECLLEYAHEEGFVPSWELLLPGRFVLFDSPLAPIRVVVEPGSSSASFTTNRNGDLEIGAVLPDGSGAEAMVVKPGNRAELAYTGLSVRSPLMLLDRARLLTRENSARFGIGSPYTIGNRRNGGTPASERRSLELVAIVGA